MMHPALTLEKCMAIAIPKLVMPASLRYVAHQFVVEKSSAGLAILDICGAIQDSLADQVIRWSTPERWWFGALGFPILPVDGEACYVSQHIQ
ncbi:hypothetical protein Y1Q_0010183 [Alligator mississippiensis]|uniref:Uncharacterized protein n=1 Tax=Alligator mississippiensis TaxID=8496 RepID=A0A151NG74_ALLMI|nr:hypothetical protein Y1Q_0010183 [Alligator mississippiensis]